jgi:CubicO group peptidase (beta-lactamase class C family)
VLAWAIENVPPVAEPGEQFFYSDTNFGMVHF